MMASIRKIGADVGKALVGPKGPRLVDEPANPDPTIRRKHRELRRKDAQFENIICQLDRTTGEIVIPKRSRGLVRALKMQAEHRLLGWIVAALLTCAFAISCLNERPAQRRPITFTEHSSTARPITRPASHSRRVRSDTTTTPTPAAARNVVPAPRMMNVQVGSQITSHYSAGALVMSGMPVYESRPIAPQVTHSTATSGKININTASVDEIDRGLPGVGPVMAASIVAARPFKSIDDLRKVRRIGARTFALLEPHVTAN